MTDNYRMLLHDIRNIATTPGTWFLNIKKNLWEKIRFKFGILSVSFPSCTCVATLLKSEHDFSPTKFKRTKLLFSNFHSFLFYFHLKNYHGVTFFVGCQSQNVFGDQSFFDSGLIEDYGYLLVESTWTQISFWPLLYTP